MVITIPAQEPHHLAALSHQLHAEGLVESLARVEVAHVQVHVPEDRAGRELFLRPGRDAQKPFEVQVLDADLQPAVRILPLASRPVGINLDPVAFGVVEVKSLADKMVRGPGQRQSLFEGALKKAAELLFARQQDGEVIKTRGVTRTLTSTRK